MPTLSNGSELIVWSEPENPNPTPDGAGHDQLFGGAARTTSSEAQAPIG
ncbi:hypothetical protein [Mesorhizobium sp.]|nr:hypothetical protein [Mesorhizobium sp.]